MKISKSSDFEISTERHGNAGIDDESPTRQNGDYEENINLYEDDSIQCPPHTTERKLVNKIDFRVWFAGKEKSLGIILTRARSSHGCA